VRINFRQKNAINFSDGIIRCAKKEGGHIMEIPEEVINRMADEIFNEIKAEAEATGKPLTFDSMEKAVLAFRQRIGQQTLQGVVEKYNTDTTEKKTAKNAGKNYQGKAVKQE